MSAGELAVDEFAEWSTAPAVVCAAEYKQDVARTQTGQTCYETAVAVILTAITGVRDSGSAVAVILAKHVSAFGYQLPPPCLAYVLHIVLLGVLRAIPRRVSLGNISLECGIRIAEYGNYLLAAIACDGIKSKEKRKDN